MSATEWMAVIGGLVFGYLIVSMLIAPRPKRSTAWDSPAPEEPARRWPEVLGVAPDASDDELRAAYRRKISEYHPDKVAGLGIELCALAERKAAEINAAYDEAWAQRGARR